MYVVSYELRPRYAPTPRLWDFETDWVGNCGVPEPVWTWRRREKFYRCREPNPGCPTIDSLLPVRIMAADSCNVVYIKRETDEAERQSSRNVVNTCLYGLEWHHAQLQHLKNLEFSSQIKYT
jgi:hypothetical protein